MDDFTGSPGVLSKSASAYEHLKRLAIRNQLRPGRRLSPTDLAGHFQISVTPVRDALVRLAAEGFIRAEASRGYFTKPWTVDEQSDLHQLLMILYVSSVELAGPSAGSTISEGFGRLERRVSSGLDGEPQAAAETYVEDLHLLYSDLANVAGNATVRAIIRNAADRTRLVRRMDLEVLDHRRATIDALRGIAAAVTAGDLVRAIDVSRTHQGQVLSRLPALIARANVEAQRLKFP
ncbi:MAG: GntR family transcriptional regulator [Phenylobacterium sp.]|uniref:GntR family transcriptional regulator n=1 Tax=Phenylobacterium sp. TaxID=1871053 RepID=UPI0027340C1E|nr:GntR family transcriptional regulator [Phenylobacterium sp.]MDP3749289.1 GntR family transcriptional regulator [Phenylobacterium sp.]